MKLADSDVPQKPLCPHLPTSDFLAEGRRAGEYGFQEKNSFIHCVSLGLLVILLTVSQSLLCKLAVL